MSDTLCRCCHMPILNHGSSCKTSEGKTIQIKKRDVAENHAPMNAVCGKCGRIYCDHENKY